MTAWYLGKLRKPLRLFLGPVIQRVINQASTAGAFYSDSPYDDDDNPSYPLDLYYNEKPGYVTVWSQHMAGGLPTSEVTGVSEMKISTYRLDSAVSFNKRYARRSRLEIISRAVERMAQEILVKQERNAWAVVLKALAEGSTTLHNGTALKHLFNSTSNGFTLDMMNKLLTRMKRIGESFAGGTPDPGMSFGITDMYMSPETMEKIRSFSYQHIGFGATNDTADDVDQAIIRDTSRDINNVTDSLRDEIYRNAGLASIWGIALHELIELGASHKYVKLLNEMNDDNIFEADGSSGSATVADTDDVCIGIDASKGAFHSCRCS